MVVDAIQHRTLFNHEGREVLKQLCKFTNRARNLCNFAIALVEHGYVVVCVDETHFLLALQVLR